VRFIRGVATPDRREFQGSDAPKDDARLANTDRPLTRFLEDAAAKQPSLPDDGVGRFVVIGVLAFCHRQVEDGVTFALLKAQAAARVFRAISVGLQLIEIFAW